MAEPATAPTVSEQDFRDILDATRQFVRTAVVPRELEIMNDNRVPDDIRDQAKDMGLFGYAIPQEWGGLGLNLVQDVEMAMELGYTTLAVRSMFGTNNGIAGQVLVGFGTDTQKERWLEPIASGECVASFALTESGAGSNPAGLRTKAVLDGDDWIITGHKRFITNAPTANLFVVFARTRPADDDTKALAAFAVAEQAKRRLIAELSELGLSTEGLSFDLLSSEHQQVFTGHQDGVITLDLAEGDDVHREQLRIAMAEPYRTLLGHFRHEIGHYYFYRLVQPSPDAVARFTELFGDPDADYQAALDRHYRDGAPAGWEEQYVSSYATMHPAEDWAETFAHYLHIRDALDTAAAFGFAPAGATFERRVLGPSGFDTLIELWLPLAWALNMVNRSMGKDDLYPFVLPAAVLEKMRFIHTAVDEAGASRAAR